MSLFPSLRRGLFSAALALAAGLLVLPAAHAQEDDDDLILEDEDTTARDDQEIYRLQQQELVGADPDIEAEAWRRYLRDYPESQFRSQIEARIAELESSFLEDTGFFEEAPGTDAAEDAKNAEMDFAAPVHFTNGNTRQRFFVGVTYGVPDVFNYVIDYEHAFSRQFSIHGGIAHRTRGFGLNLEVGAKYAVVKSTRTGLLFSVGADFKVAFSTGGVNVGFFIPKVNFGAIINDRFQLQVTAALDLTLTDSPISWAFLYGLHLHITASERVGIYIETDGRVTRVAYGQLPAPQTLAFQRASVGARIKVADPVRLQIGVNVPFLQQYWSDYSPIGVDVAFQGYFGGRRQNRR